MAPKEMPIKIPVLPATGNEFKALISVFMRGIFSPKDKMPLNKSRNMIVEIPKTIANRFCFLVKNRKHARLRVKARTANKLDSTVIIVLLVRFTKNWLLGPNKIPIKTTVINPTIKNGLP